MATRYVWHELHGWHDTATNTGLFPANPLAGSQPVDHFESAESKKRMHQLLAVSGLLERLVPLSDRPATEEEILRVHSRAHLERTRTESMLPKGGDAGDGFSSFGCGGYDIALLAAGGAIVGADSVFDGPSTTPTRSCGRSRKAALSRWVR